MDTSDLRNRFTYHPPKDTQPARYEQIRSKAHELAVLINELVPTESREKSLSITNLEQAVFWANAAIARNE